MNASTRKKILAYLAEQDDDNLEELTSGSDEDLRSAFNEHFGMGETIRSMQFAAGSSVSVEKLGELFTAADDAGIYGPFETYDEAAGHVSFWGYDEIVYDSGEPVEV